MSHACRDSYRFRRQTVSQLVEVDGDEQHWSCQRHSPGDSVRTHPGLAEDGEKHSDEEQYVQAKLDAEWLPQRYFSPHHDLFLSTHVCG